jgi:hypothetical protein
LESVGFEWIDQARMPRANELPVTLAPLVRRNVVEDNFGCRALEDQ